MTFTLGTVPQQMQVVLVPDADFTAVLRNSAGNWATGTVITLKFNTSQVWTATVSGDTATFNQQETAVNIVIAAGAVSARLFYNNGTVDIQWATGVVTVVS